MTEHDPIQPADPADPLGFLFYRGQIGRGFFFLGLMLEAGLLFLGLVAFAQAMNPTGSGGGPELLLVFIPIVAWIHSLITAKRLRDAGKAVGAMVILSLAPFVFVGAVVTVMWNSNQTMETIGGGAWLIVIFAVLLFVLPGLLPRKPASVVAA